MMMMNSYQTDGKSLMASSSSSSSSTAARVMEKPISQEQTQQQPLKCPRCDSSNTKFCYYNNYSLSQPRHFCKACKRYWTRGGTLRNVPVGGGCRKNNKRVRRSSASASSSSSSPAAAIDVSSSSTSPAVSSSAPLQIPGPTPPPQINPLFYGLPINPPFPRLFGSRVSSSESSYDSMISTSPGFLGGHGENGFVSSSSNPLLSSYPVFRSSSSITTSSPITSSTTLASLIAASSLDQQRKFNNASGDDIIITNRNFLGMPSYNNGESVMAGNTSILENGELLKGESQNRLNWNGGVPMNINHHNLLQTEGVVNINYSASSSSDPSFPWNGANWMDPSSMASSLPAFSHLAI